PHRVHLHLPRSGPGGPGRRGPPPHGLLRCHLAGGRDGAARVRLALPREASALPAVVGVAPGPAARLPSRSLRDARFIGSAIISWCYERRDGEREEGARREPGVARRGPGGAG